MEMFMWSALARAQYLGSSRSPLQTICHLSTGSTNDRDPKGIYSADVFRNELTHLVQLCLRLGFMTCTDAIRRARPRAVHGYGGAAQERITIPSVSEPNSTAVLYNYLTQHRVVRPNTPVLGQKRICILVGCRAVDPIWKAELPTSFLL